MKEFPTIYKKDSKGKVREWRMEVEGNCYRTVSGLAGGQQVTSAWKEAYAKNVGKVNSTTDEEQAVAEVEALYTKRLTREYHEKLENIEEKRFFKPMLATKWENRASKLNYSEDIFFQPKLDGIRCLASSKGLFTREGKPIVGAPHIMQALAPYFKDHPDIIFDGELYNHKLKDDFNEIVSMVKKSKPTEEDIAKSEGMVQYHIYDLPSSSSIFNQRLCKLETILPTVDEEYCIQVVDTEQIHSEDDIDKCYEAALANGYEGGMIRLDGEYQQKRSNYLIKRKEFEDKEFEIVSIEEGKGNWAGYAKRIIFRIEDGRTCGAGLKGNQAFCKQALADAEQYVGKQVTVQYFTRTPDGMPRFPIAKVLHKDKRW